MSRVGGYGNQTGAIVSTLPKLSLTTALNCAVAPTTSVVSGATTIDAAGPALTVIVAVAVTVLHVTDMTVVPGVVPAVNRPVCVIVPLPETIAQVGVFASTSPLLSRICREGCVALGARVP